MKPAWDQLGDEYAGSSSVLIADADCTVQEKVCEKFGIRGYPTIKYFKDGDNDGEAYNGGRDFDSLKKFVVDNLEPKCDVANPEGCSEKAQNFISKFSGKNAEEIKAQIDRLEGMKAKPMKAELKAWLGERLHILKQMGAVVKEDL